VRVALLTREWPPAVYGGAGVHVEHLVAELRRHAQVDVHCFGEPRVDASAHQPWSDLASANPALGVLSADLAMAAAVDACDVVHSHTWYANLAGRLVSAMHGVPHVMTAHSLEPLRPWKAEQLGAGYAVSSWVERTAIEAADAVIAVSQGMRGDILATYQTVDPDRVHVVHNGIDTDVYRPVEQPDVLARYGVATDRPVVLFVGRITRQKGLPDLLASARWFDPEAQLVVCASAPDTADLYAEVAAAMDALQVERTGVVWVQHNVPQPDVIALYSHATVFVCPSVYEPLGIVNLEAMACGTAVVASAVGGIPEVVDNNRTGLLVPPSDPRALADAVNALLGDPQRAAAYGRAGRKRAEHEFGWGVVAERTLAVYEAARATP
jgi:alpha-maltose-1-phosphate synthase